MLIILILNQMFFYIVYDSIVCVYLHLFIIFFLMHKVINFLTFLYLLQLTKLAHYLCRYFRYLTHLNRIGFFKYVITFTKSCKDLFFLQKFGFNLKIVWLKYYYYSLCFK